MGQEELQTCGEGESFCAIVVIVICSQTSAICKHLLRRGVQPTPAVRAHLERGHPCAERLSASRPRISAVEGKSLAVGPHLGGRGGA